MNVSCFWPLVYRAARLPLAAWGLLAVCLGALGMALIGQFFFGMSPCILCLYQRVPYVLVAFVAAFLAMKCRDAKLDRLLLLVCALAFLIGSGIAVFHSGVERHWWAGTDECGVAPLDQPVGEIDIKKLREDLLKADVVRCDVIEWSLFGLTLANMNVFAFLALSWFACFAARRVGKAEGQEGACCCCKNKT